MNCIAPNVIQPSTSECVDPIPFGDRESRIKSWVPSIGSVPGPFLAPARQSNPLAIVNLVAVPLDSCGRSLKEELAAGKPADDLRLAASRPHLTSPLALNNSP
jgi:hypothetical protein